MQIGVLFNRWMWRSIVLVAIGFTSSNVSAQIIDEGTEFSVSRPPPKTESGIEVFSDIRHGLNALAASNLPGGFEQKRIPDTLWVKGVSGYVAHPLANKIYATASAGAFHVNYFKNSKVNFFGARAGAGLVLVPSDRASLYVTTSCSGEFDGKKLKRYYSHCGPSVGAQVTLGSPRKFHVSLSGGAYLALGDRNEFARYKEANARISIATGGKVRFAVEPQASVRDFSTPSLFPAILEYKRRDYNASLPVSLTFRKPRWELGIVAEPSASWSTDANYRMWDFRFGPSFKVRF